MALVAPTPLNFNLTPATVAPFAHPRQHSIPTPQPPPSHLDCAPCTPPSVLPDFNIV